MEVRVPIEKDNPSIMRDEQKCIKCGQCKRVCTEQIGVHNRYTLEQTDNTALCIYCGQCSNVCPTNSITEKYEYEQFAKAISDKNKIVVVNTSPSVRVALGEEFGLPLGQFVQGKMVALLKKLGADYVLDTNFAADLTIVEEASELIERIVNKTAPLPQFTSCCPAWVEYAETFYPEILPNLSTAKSPIGMQGPTVKTYFAKKMGIDHKKIFNVALTPCTAKKHEIRREEMCASAKYHNDPTLRDMDCVITTRELAILAKQNNIDFNQLEDMPYDDLMGQASGAGVIFGNTGGVMEAALRTAYEYITKQKAPLKMLSLTPIRGCNGIREASVNIGDMTLNVAVVYGTANAAKLLQLIKSGQKQYHFVEVMTCPNGCIGGGGQPKNLFADNQEIRKQRMAALYNKDESMSVRTSHENQQIVQLYNEFYGKPLSHTAEAMLHTTYFDKSSKIKNK